MEEQDKLRFFTIDIASFSLQEQKCGHETFNLVYRFDKLILNVCKGRLSQNPAGRKTSLPTWPRYKPAKIAFRSEALPDFHTKGHERLR